MKNNILQNLSHVGMTVHNIAETISFYRKLTSVEICAGPIHINDDLAGTVILVDKPDFHSCIVRIGDRNFELIEHHSSRGRAIIGNHNDVGGVHLAFMVEDIDRAFEAVKELGLIPTTKSPYTSQQLGGYRAFFFRDTNGFQVEVGQLNE